MHRNSGLAFALMILLIGCSTSRQDAISRRVRETPGGSPAPVPLQVGEDVLAEVSANLVRGHEVVGGKMRITNRRVLFQPAAYNWQKKPVKLALADVAEVREGRTLARLHSSEM